MSPFAGQTPEPEEASCNVYFVILFCLKGKMVRACVFLGGHMSGEAAYGGRAFLSYTFLLKRYIEKKFLFFTLGKDYTYKFLS